MRHNWQKDISACGLSGVMSLKGKMMSGSDIIRSIAKLHERSNGLGGGFAAYGIYPKYKDCYAFHVMYYTLQAREETERILAENFEIVQDEAIPVNREIHLSQTPILLWRYFLKPKTDAPKMVCFTNEEDFMIDVIQSINSKPEHEALIFSSGKNMGIFKAVGYPEEVGAFFRLDEYDGYLWTAHGRFPTNTQGWWGGAHPFALLNWSVVHNGEISSYGINKRYLEMFGYLCNLYTDTEAITYLFDLLIRRDGLTEEQACQVLAAPFWSEIDRMDPKEKTSLEALRMVYSSALINGPFAVIAANSRTMIGLNDRIKLRPLVAAQKDDKLYLSSEEVAIREICDNPDTVWSPRGGEPVIGRLEEEI